MQILSDSLRDIRWLETVPISKYSINPKRFSDMVNAIYFYTHNIAKKIIAPRDVYKIFNKEGYVFYDKATNAKHLTGKSDNIFLELRGANSLFVTENGQRFLLQYLKLHYAFD